MESGGGEENFHREETHKHYLSQVSKGNVRKSYGVGREAWGPGLFTRGYGTGSLLVSFPDMSWPTLSPGISPHAVHLSTSVCSIP